MIPNSVILTVDGSNHPELAAQIIEESEGHILAGESFAEATPTQTTTMEETSAAASAPAATREQYRTGSQVLGYRDASKYARGEQVDEQRRLQLREERLNIGKEQVPLGEAQVGKEIVEHRQDVDVPTIREELFIERRSAAETSGRGDAGEIGEGEPIRIPLMREHVTVTKRPVVTGDVVVGKRQITETQRVSETTREERLKVTDPTGHTRAAGSSGLEGEDR